MYNLEELTTYVERNCGGAKLNVQGDYIAISDDVMSSLDQSL